MSIASPAAGALTALELQHLDRLIDASLDEDLQGSFSIDSPLQPQSKSDAQSTNAAPQIRTMREDVTSMSCIPSGSQSKAIFLAKQTGILSGLSAALHIFHRINPQFKVEFTIEDGTQVTKGQEFGTVSGSTRDLLLAERLVLNLMQRMSGIATATHAYVEAIQKSISPASTCELLDTRKTVPGLRLLDKLAVRHGGGRNHRLGLYDMIMLKDNHIAACGGSIAGAVRAAQQYLASTAAQRVGHPPVQIEVETRTLDEVRQALECPGIHRLMLDNMVKVKRHDMTQQLQSIDTSMLCDAIQIIQASEYGRTLETEASGNVLLDTVGEIARSGVRFISCGALTHSVAALDISLKIQ